MLILGCFISSVVLTLFYFAFPPVFHKLAQDWLKSVQVGVCCYLFELFHETVTKSTFECRLI
jgi:hypothetical protein